MKTDGGDRLKRFSGELTSGAVQQARVEALGTPIEEV
jgi:hypothetical protein